MIYSVGQSSSMEENISTVALQPWDDERTKRFSNHALVGRIVSGEKNLMPKHVVKSIINQSWGFTEPVELLILQPNIFVLFFKNKGDRTRAWNLRPWLIQGHHFVLQPWKPDYMVEELDLDYTSFWVHVHGLPFNFISLSNVKAIGDFLGEFEEIDEDKLSLSGCLRLRVKWNIRKPLIPGFPLKRENLPDAWISLQYEKLSDFCSKCGLLGHDIEMCESLSTAVVTQKESEVNLQKLGPWMKTSSACCPGFETLDTSSGEKQQAVRERIPTLNAMLGTPTEEKPPVSGGGTPTFTEEKQPVAREGTSTLNAAPGAPPVEKQSAGRKATVNPSPANNQQQGKCRYKTPSERRKWGFTTVNGLKPGTNGYSLIVKVLHSDIVLQRGIADSHTCIAECLVGDETGTIIFTARNNQVDVMEPGRTVIIRNAKINMFKGCMRLAVDKLGRIQVAKPADFEVDEEEDNNRSLDEYDRWTV